MITHPEKVLFPDVCVFDLDPSDEEPDVLRTATLGLRDLLGERGLPRWVKSSDSKGFHILVSAPTRTAGTRTRPVTTSGSLRARTHDQP